MLEPYHDRDGILIYHGTAEAILPQLESVDLLLTDPPYGIGKDGTHGDHSTGRGGGRRKFDSHGWDSGTSDQAIEMAIGMAARSIVWGGNYYRLEPSGSWLVWDKGQKLDQADAELAWTNLKIPTRSIVINRQAIKRDGPLHPTQKPLELMRWCMGFVPEAEVILDTFMGSGSTLVAAKLEGRRAIGIERVRDYCNAAVDRLAQGVLF